MCLISPSLLLPHHLITYYLTYYPLKPYPSGKMRSTGCNHLLRTFQLLIVNENRDREGEYLQLD